MAEEKSNTDETVSVVDNAEESRFEVHVGGQRAGFADYRVSGDTMDFTHTEVDPAFSGRGLAQQLADHALGEARTRGHSVLPHCEFIAKHIAKNPEHADLVPADRRGEFGLA